MRAILVASSALALSGCGHSIAEANCSDVAIEAVGLSKGALIKIVGGEVVSHTPDRIECRGTGVYADTSRVKTSYRAYVDEDGDTMVEYDIKEAVEAEAANAKRKLELDLEQAERDARRDYNQAMRVANGTATGDRW